MKVWAVIPARGGSKGIPNKNLAPLAGVPLLVHSIRTALECSQVERAVVSTDSDEIGAVALRHGAEFVRRPAELSTDAAATEPALLHVLELARQEQRPLPDIVALLQPTSPYRKPGTLDRCLAAMEAAGADSLLTACESHSFFWKRAGALAEALYDYRRRPRRQDIPAAERWCRENGSVYLTRAELLLREKNRLGGRIGLHLMSEEESFEIDTPLDLLVAERIMETAAVQSPCAP